MCYQNSQDTFTLKEWLGKYPDGFPEDLEKKVFEKERLEQEKILRKSLTREGQKLMTQCQDPVTPHDS